MLGHRESRSEGEEELHPARHLPPRANVYEDIADLLDEFPPDDPMAEAGEATSLHRSYTQLHAGHPAISLPPVDVLLLVDASSSIGLVSYETLKRFLSDFVDDIDVSSPLFFVPASPTAPALVSTFHARLNLLEHLSLCLVKRVVASGMF